MQIEEGTNEQVWPTSGPRKTPGSPAIFVLFPICILQFAFCNLHFFLFHPRHSALYAFPALRHNTPLLCGNCWYSGMNPLSKGVLTVKTYLYAALIVGLILVAATTASLAQTGPRPAPRQAPPRQAPPPQQPSGTVVALIDINAVFANNVRFKAALDEMRNDARSYEASLETNKKEAASLNEKLGEYKIGSPEYKQIEGQLVEVAATTQAGMALKRREFLEREAKIYYQAYMEVAEHVKDHSIRNNIALVIRYNADKIDDSNRNSIISGVNRQVVYQEIIDITPIIIQRLNRGTPPPSVGAGPQIPKQRR